VNSRTKEFDDNIKRSRSKKSLPKTNSRNPSKDNKIIYIPLNPEKTSNHSSKMLIQPVSNLHNNSPKSNAKIISRLKDQLKQELKTINDSSQS
jgi:DNA polymerase IIIc chi subunit